MANWFVRKTGLDANAGTSAGAAWLTLTHALSAGAGPVGGDTIWVGAGVYREQVTLNLTAPTSALVVAGDVDGSQTGDAGEVRLTTWLTNDGTAATSGALVSGNTKPFLTWKKIVFEGGTGNSTILAGAGCHDWTLQDCTVLSGAASGNAGISGTTTGGTAFNLTADRCIFLLFSSGSAVTVNSGLTTADYSCPVTLRNCLVVGGGGTALIASGTNGSGTGLPYGWLVDHCTVWGRASAVFTNAGTVSATTTGVTVQHCLINALDATALSAATAGQIVEDYNLFAGTTARNANVTAGTHSVAAATLSPLVHLGQEVQYGALPRPAYTPVAGSPILGAIADGADTLAVDLLNRPRPAGGNSANRAYGCLERHDTGVQTASPTHSGGFSLQLAGPSDHEFALPVDAIATTVAVWAQYDASYGAGANPTLIVTNGGECGVADASTTLGAVGAGVWGQISLAFTPTARGVVTARLVSTAAAAGNAYFDDVTIS